MDDDPKWAISNYPILFDRDAQSAQLPDYFWQDIFVAKEIIKQNPRRHLDVGSRIDGFIAHLACIRKVEVLDIRPLATHIDNIEFIQWDITNSRPELHSIADCVSCLHTLEHIGLGRYGDKLNPDGWKQALHALVELLADRGNLWLSVPIGIQRVEFNAQRIFDPITIINASATLGLTLVSFFYLTESGIKESSDYQNDFALLARNSYGLGIFLFVKGRAASNLHPS